MVAFSLALRHITRVMNIIGLSVCGILFYLQVLTYINKQLESHSLTRSVGMCKLSFVDIITYLVMHGHKWLGWSKG